MNSKYSFNKPKDQPSRSSQPYNKRQELIKKAINFRMVNSLNEGGRQPRMSVFVAVGTGTGKVGFGLGKAKDTASAVAKAIARASKNMIRIGMREKRTIHHAITAKFCSSRVTLLPAIQGSGMRCSNTARLFLECLGIKDISVKIWGRHPINCIKALSKALSSISSPREIALNRGVSLFRVLNRKPKNNQKSPENVQSGNANKMEVSISNE